MKKIRAGVIGASGYAGAELVRLLWMHPEVELVGISSKSYLGQKIADLYPSFYQIIDFHLKRKIVSLQKVMLYSLHCHMG